MQAYESIRNQLLYKLYLIIKVHKIFSMIKFKRHK